MAIREHPQRGSIVWCDFSRGFREPEMVKKRPALVVSKKISARVGLCTVVALSPTAPAPKQLYHYHLELNVDFPPHLDLSNSMWVKGDMINTVSFERIDFIQIGRNTAGKRTYYLNTITHHQMKAVEACMLHSLGLSTLTKHLYEPI